MLEKLYEYLLSDDISLYEEDIFKIIPELKYEKGFDQKSEWHEFDVWNHTLATILACDNNKEDRLVLLLHDIGKPFSYQDDNDVRHFKNHALKSAEIAKKILIRLNVPFEDISVMLQLIGLHSTRIDPKDINGETVEFYKRLLKIQKCDACGYEKEHAKLILKQLEEQDKLLR